MRLICVPFRLGCVLFLVAYTAFSQRPPVVLVDGYHLLCQNDNLSSTQDFGELQQRLQQESVSVFFFGTCSVPGKPSIEDLGNALGAMILNLNVAQVDLVSHSMGGLVVRSYLSGKQSTPGVFRPPGDTKVRKWVSIATPNFGALLYPPITYFLPDIQAQELAPASQFLFDLATWNQNRDDLRGVDAVGIIGDAGGLGPLQGTNDGTVAVTSASLSFAFAMPDERTRVLPYCHGTSDLTAILGLGCSAPPLANIQSDNPLSWSIIDSFLAGSDAWKTVGHSPSQDSLLSRYGGTLTQHRDNVDNPLGSLDDENFVSNPPLLGGYSVVIDKPGPSIALIAPSAAVLPTLSLAPRMLISIYGTNLASSTVSVNGQALVLNYNGNYQINALLPDNIAGINKLTVSNPSGMTSTNIFVESANPAVFTMNGTGTGPAAAILSGNYVSLYLTGLGVSGVMPQVTLNGVPVAVQYAGPAPGFAGLDQINFRLPPGTSTGVVLVSVGEHVSNAVTLPPG